MALRSTLAATAVVALAISAPLAAESMAVAAADLGKAAPSFSLKDTDGKIVSLADFRGKTVVLEWFNPQCPFVKYAHRKGALRDQGNAAAEKGVVWLAINSAGPGKQGAGLEINRGYKQEYTMSYPVLIDESGEVGHAYGARTTPHMFVIDGEGTLVYRGGIDNAPLGEAEGAVVNYVEAALANLASGKAVETAETKPYGCSVKY